MFDTLRKSREREREREREISKLCLLCALVSCLISVFCGYVAPARADVDAIQITGETNPKIVELYQKLQDKRNEISNIESKRIDALTENANAMRENENRMENRILGATTTAATGLGTWAAASGLAETRADADALTAMRAYLATFQCEYGGGQTVDYGPNDVALPGGNELTEYYNEYKSLAESLKETKAALGLAPGIESEPIIDRADTGLYQNAATGITTGAYASLARGILDPDGDDAARIAEQQNESSQKLKIGATALGAGVIGGIIGNYELNKDAPKELSEQINQEYDAQVESLNQETQNIETELNDAIAENAALVQEYNDQLQEHQNQVAAINNGPQNCRELFATYIEKISTMSPVKNATDRVPDADFPNIDDQKTLLAKCSGCADQGGIFDPQTLKCPCPPEKPDIIDGKCGVKPVVETPTPAAQQAVTEPPAELDPSAETPEEEQVEEEKTDADMCPATGNALKSITDKHKVGDSCTSDLISQGTITKRPNGTCTCRATGCWTPYTPKGGQCVKDKAETTTGTQNKNDYVDENGFCKPYKHSNWFFNNEGNEQISKYFNKICDDFAKAHSCKRKDLNTGKRINTEGEQGKPGYAFEYEWICNADSSDYLAAQERINQRNQNLAYENVCTKLKPGETKTENGIKRQCAGLFSDINIPDYKTQLELAKARIGTSAACSEKREPRKNKASNNPIGYYTNCNTTNDKERYTFIFSGVSNNKTTPENLMRAACATYGVKFGGQGGELGRKQPYCSYTYKSVDNDPTCNKIDALAQKFGYTARIVRGTGCVLDTTGGIGGNQLTQSGMRSDEKIRDLKTAFGIYNSLFANISTNMDEWLYDQMKNIVSNEMKRAGHSDPLVEFECFPTKSFALDKGVEAKLFRDVRGRNVLTCRANGHDIDFIFHNLGHVTKRRANASKEGLTCIFGSNGKYDGRQCWGITEEDCTKLNNTIKEHAKNCSQCGAQWLPKAGDEEGFCSLTKSTKVEKTNKGLEIAGNIAMIAGGAILTVMSGGMAMPMLVTEIALMGVELTGATVAAVEEKHMRNVAEEFLRKTQYCHDATCAQELLTDSEVHRILNLESNLDDKISNTIDDKMSELLGVIPDDAPLYVALLAGIEDKPNCNFWRNATAQCEWAQFWHAWANVAQFASLGVALGRSAVRFIHARQAITKVATQTAKKMTRAQAKRIQSIDENIARYQKQLKTAKGSEAKKLQAEIETQKSRRARILNEVGTKDADEIAKLQKAAFDEQAIKDAQSEYQAALKKRNEMADYMAKHNGNPPQGKIRFDVKDINDEVAKAEKKLKDLGQEVTPAEPLQIGKKPTTTPKDGETPKPKDGDTPGAKPETKPAEPTPETKPTEPEAPKNSPVGNPVKPKSQKIAEARQRGDLGYHGTNANIAMDDMIRPSANSSDQLGEVGFGIAKDYDAAERYAVRRVIERQNIGKNITFQLDDHANVLVITNNSSTPLNLSNKTGYVYTTAKDSNMAWKTLDNGYAGVRKAADPRKAGRFEFEAAQMPNAVEILDKKAFNIDDLVSQGKVKIVEPNVQKTTPKATPTPKSAPKATPKPEAKPVTTPATPKRTPAQEEAEWRTLYEKYAPENQTFDNFKKSFGNNLDEVEEYAKNWDLNVTENMNIETTRQKSWSLWQDFNKKYGANQYDEYRRIMNEGISADEYLEAQRQGISANEYLRRKLGWSKEQFEDANKVRAAQRDFSIALNDKNMPTGKGANYSTVDYDIVALRKELQNNLSSSAYADIEPFFQKGNLTLEEYNNLVDYVSHKKYDEQMLIGAFNKEPELNSVASRVYDNFLAARSENVRKISDVAGVSRKSLTGPQVARNEFVQNFVSKRVSMYEDIITKNPSIYNRAKRWNQLSIEDREKLCKEIFEIADNKLMIQHTDFAVKDLVAMGYESTTTGLQLEGKVYLSSRHFPNMSFKEAMKNLAHEQAHKVDKLNPNRGIYGSQLADLGSKEGYIQGYAGHAYADYRRELTEQSSWLIGDAMEKAIAALGL